VASRDDLSEETDGGRWPTQKGTVVSTAMEAALWRRGGGARCLCMSWNRRGDPASGCRMKVGKEGSDSVTRGQRSACNDPAAVGGAPAHRTTSKQGRGSC
jgi:hypothetical protein